MPYFVFYKRNIHLYLRLRKLLIFYPFRPPSWISAFFVIEAYKKLISVLMLLFLRFYDIIKISIREYENIMIIGV